MRVESNSSQSKRLFHYIMNSINFAVGYWRILNITRYTQPLMALIQYCGFGKAITGLLAIGIW